MRIAALVCILASGCVLPSANVELTGSGTGRVTASAGGFACTDSCELIGSGEVTLTATANEGSTFTGWSGDVCFGTEPCTLRLVDDLVLNADFRLNSYEVKVERTGEGRVVIERAGIICGDTCSALVDHGEVLRIVATPAAGWALRSVGGGAACGDTSCTLTVREQTTIDVVFVRLNTLAVELESIDGAGGTVWSTPAGINCQLSGSMCSAAFEPGSTVTLVAFADTSSEFLGWSGACSGTDTMCIVPMDQARTVIARFGRPVGCTTTVVSNTPASAFNTLLTTPNTSICLADNVTITGQVVLGANNITIATRGFGMGKIVNFSGGAIDTNGHSNIKLSRLDIEARGPELTAAVRVTGNVVSISDSVVRCNSHNCYLVHASNGAQMTIARTSLLGGIATQSYSYGVYGYFNTFVTITDSTLRSYGPVLWNAVSTHFVVRGSVLESLGNTETMVVYNSGATLLLESSKVVTRAAALVAGGAASGVTITVNGTAFRRAAGTTASGSPFVSERSDDVFRSMTSNSFCNEGIATTDGAFVAPLIAGPYAMTAMATFDSVAHTGPADCAD